MDAVEFVKEFRRMCNSYISCSQCKLWNDNQCHCELQGKLMTVENVILVVEQWAKENPIKTRQSVFLGQYPEARINNDGSLVVCPRTVSATHRDKYGNCAIGGISCFDCQREFWMQEAKDV